MRSLVAWRVAIRLNIPGRIPSCLALLTLLALQAASHDVDAYGVARGRETREKAAADAEKLVIIGEVAQMHMDTQGVLLPDAGVAEALAEAAFTIAHEGEQRSWVLLTMASHR